MGQMTGRMDAEGGAQSATRASSAAWGRSVRMAHVPQTVGICPLLSPVAPPVPALIIPAHATASSHKAGDSQGFSSCMRGSGSEGRHCSSARRVDGTGIALLRRDGSALGSFPPASHGSLEGPALNVHAYPLIDAPLLAFLLPGSCPHFLSLASSDNLADKPLTFQSLPQSLLRGNLTQDIWPGRHVGSSSYTLGSKDSAPYGPYVLFTP